MKRVNIIFLFLISFFGFFLFYNKNLYSNENSQENHIAVIDMNMMILPGTSAYFEKSIKKAVQEGAELVILKLDTPGGVLQSANDIIKNIFDSPVPVVVFVSPQGAVAASAGALITMAGDVAVMSKGTSIGAIHPVDSQGNDIQKDMRKKIEEMTVAISQSIAERRNRNISWAKEAVLKSNSLRAGEAVKNNVIDFIANDVSEVLEKLNGRKISFKNQDYVFKDLSDLEIKNYEISFKDSLLNILSNPTVASLLWIGATLGLLIELYHTGAVFPGVLGAICLVLALIVNQVLPVNIGGLVLIILGFSMIVLEFYVSSIILGVGGVVAVAFGVMTLVDLSSFPELTINYWAILPSAIFCCLLFFIISYVLVKSMKRKEKTGLNSLVGEIGVAGEDFKNGSGLVFIDGSNWSAVLDKEKERTDIKKGDKIKVVSFQKGHLVLIVKKE